MSEPRAYIRNLTDLARQLNVTFPKKVADVLAADASLPTAPSTSAEVAEQIGAAVGTKDYDKVVAEGLQRVALAEAADRVRRRVRDAADAAKWSAIREHADTITASFRDAVADDLATLAEHAPRVPLATKPDTIGTANPAVYDACYRSDAAVRRLDVAARAIGMLTGVAAASQRLVFVDVPDIPADDVAARLAFVHALNGQRVLHGRQGATTDAVWYSAVAHAGGSFAFASGADVRARAERVAAYRVIPSGYDPSTGRVAALID